MKRAALYVRVSSHGQVRDGYSLSFQEEILKEFCQRESYQVADVYRDGGESGSSIKRKDLLRLIEDARLGRFDLVLIFRVDRFSRDPVDLLALVRELESRGIKLRSVTEAVDAGDPAGELMLTILGAIGKFVRQNIIQNAMLGKIKRAQTGRFTGGRVPFGYALDEHGLHRPDQQPWWNGYSAAEVARLIFTTYVKMAAEGRGCASVAGELNRMGIPGPSTVWAHATVHQILTNPVYAGDFAYNKRSHPLHKRSQKLGPDEWVVVRDAHEPLVERTLWEQVQTLLKGNRTFGGRPAGMAAKGLVTGFLRCGECGAALTPRRKGKEQPWIYYTCVSRYSERRLREGTACSSFPWLRATEMEALVWDALVQMATEPHRLEALQIRLNGGAAPELDEAEAEVARLTKKWEGLEQQVMRLTTAFAEGKLPEELWQRQLERLQRDREGVSGRLAQGHIRLAELRSRAPLAVDLRTELQAALTEDATLEERREALSILVGPRGIRVMKDGAVELDLRIPAGN